MNPRKDIRALSLEQLQDLFSSLGEKPFRAKQVYEWLWKHSARNFDDMTNLGKGTRQYLREHYEIREVVTSEKQVSSDGTIKCAFRLADNYVVEGVLIPAGKRLTACISSQVGCSLSCKFCATGRLKRMRNLNADEIYDQVVNIRNIAREAYDLPLTNIVYMGMGEPLLNYSNTLKSVEKITSTEGLGLSPKRITVSTAGIAKMIHKLADDQVKFNLALSLHAADDEKRNAIMPINEQNSLDSLADALWQFHLKTRNRITLEYIIFRDFNDTLKDAEDLFRFWKMVPSRINIIEYNPIEGGEFSQAEPGRSDAFKKYLTDRGVIVNIRRSRGKDIDAACGQLANKNRLSEPA